MANDNELQELQTVPKDKDSKNQEQKDLKSKLQESVNQEAEHQVSEFQVSPKQKETLEKQQYRFAGSHSAVKVCGWTKSMLRNLGGCYKFLFYGIRSHQCLQMTTSMFCASRCKFCWRGEKAPVSKEWYGPVDEPKVIIDGSIEAHKQLLVGFQGSDKTKPEVFKQSENVKHVALSLTGEPITYPKINEILEEFHKQKISTFLVTNAQYPEQLLQIKNVTQFYISLDAPNKKMLKEIDVPLFPDYYGRLLKSLDIMREKKFRSCIRLTIIKGLNDVDLEGYKELIERGQPDFIEVKGYMHVGASQQILLREHMPQHDEIKEFSEKLIAIMPEYEIISHHAPSRVYCLIHKNLKRKQFLNFAKFFEIVNAGGEAKALDYSSEKMCPN